MGDVSRFPSFLRRAAAKEQPIESDDVRNRTLKYLNDRFYYAPPEPEPQQLETDDDGLVPPTRQGEYKLED